ncbi:hypothetical protein HK096_009612, partial [Nowakowskiella sp. JEL0078]
YVHLNFPGLGLSVSKENVCNACVRIKTQLMNATLTDTDHEALLSEKHMHLQGAIDQYRTMSQAVKAFVHQTDLSQCLPNKILPD